MRDKYAGYGKNTDFLFLKVEVNRNFRYMNEGRRMLE